MERHLAPGGKIVIAIENRLGLKYWAGCAEDHVGPFLRGTRRLSTTRRDVHTYFENGADPKLFHEAGEFPDRTFYYPYPDYKFPFFNLLGQLTFREKETSKNNICNYDHARRLLLFDESRVFDTLIDNGLFPEFSNSFLVLLGKEES